MLLSLTFSLTVSAAEAGDKSVLGRFFRHIPVSEAHSSFGSANNRALAPDSIKVLVWNIKKTEMKPWQTEFSSFAKGKDIILVQEAYDIDRMVDEIKTYDGFRFDMGKSFTYNLYNNHATGTMVGSHVEPEEVIVTQTVDHEPMTGTPKAMTYAKYPVEGSDKSLLVISIHAINFTTIGPFKRNLLQAKAEIDKHDGPVLFAGDFNTHHALRTNYLFNMMKEMKFTPITFKNGEQRMKFKLTGSYLDHGFVRGLKVKSAECVGTSKGSDHKPLLIELAL